MQIAAGLVAFSVLPGFGAADFDLEDLDAENVEVSADRFDYEADRNLYIAEGNVRIHRGRRSIDADWIVFSRTTQRGVAHGNVRFLDGDQELRAQFLQFDLVTLRGLVYRASLDTGEGGFLVDADRLLKTGDETYTVKAGVFTTCRCPEGEEDPWRIKAGSAEVRLGGYAVARNTNLEILGVPVIWLPWMIFPVKAERETGLLFPEFGFTKDNGFEVGLPFFWAARDNINVILTPSYLTKRGFKPKAQVEYVFGERSEGSAFASFVDDDKRSDKKKNTDQINTSGDEFEEKRWAVKWDHDQFLPDAWRLKANVNVISDNKYTEDFEEMWDYRFDRYLESSIFGFKHFGDDGGLGLVVAVQQADDLQNVDSRDRDRFVLQRRPFLKTELLSAPIEPLFGIVANSGFEYINFHSDRMPQKKWSVQNPSSASGDDLVFVDVEAVGKDRFLDIGVDSLPRINLRDGFNTRSGEDDGIFQEGEPIADRGHRFVLHPRFARPFRLLDTIEVYPEIGYREMLYTTRAQNFDRQGHVTARFDLRTRLERGYGEPGQQRWSHVIEPVLGYVGITSSSGKNDPFFVPQTSLPQNRLRQLEHDNLILDPSDRISSRNNFTLGFTNRFYRGSRQLGEFTISGDYNLLGKQSNFGRIVAEGFSQRFDRVQGRVNLSIDPENGDVEEGLVAVRVEPLSWLVLGAGYRYRDRMPKFFELVTNSNPWASSQALAQVHTQVGLLVGGSWALQIRNIYDVEENRSLVTSGGIEYRSKCGCWALGVDIEEDKGRGVRIGFRYSLLGIGDDRLRSNSLSSFRQIRDLR